MLKKAIEFFIPYSDNDDVEYQRRVRLITYTLFITAFFSLFYVTVSWMANFLMGEIIMLSAFISFFALLILLKAGLNIFIISNLFGFFGILCITGSIYFSGGLQSPVLPWLATTPIIILLLAGKKSGSFWAVMSVLTVLMLGAMKELGDRFPPSLLPNDTGFTLACYAGLILIIFVISIVFENVRERAFNAERLQKKKLEKTLTDLKATQAQLVQSEKMASLGELTAGIAHEIQNPLNFITNFADVNTDLIEEWIEESGDAGGDIVSLANDIKTNNDKIIFHGKRADGIVKGMLQHSRKNTGQKEPTNINALCDEYLRLSYHGLRAKDKSFNADFKTEFDETIGNISIVPQDIGRVLLNLFNNAFYVVNEKKKISHENYKPLVFIKSKKIKDTIEIRVNDNGSGIPKTILDKIFQPFFTTKPTGSGTGLGLSLSYDIITKEHNGTIKAESKEGEGTTFIITLPL